MPRLSGLKALTADCGVSAIALRAEPADVIEKMADYDVLSLTRNAAASLSAAGRLGPPQTAGAPLRSAYGATSLRLHAQSIGEVRAVTASPSRRRPHALHIFDLDGVSLYEGYFIHIDNRREAHPFVAYDCETEVAAARAEQPSCTAGWIPQPVHPCPGAADVGYHFDSILHDNGISRRASLPSWGNELAWQIAPARIVEFFAFMCDIRMPIGVAVGNLGIVQYHVGGLNRLRASPNTLHIALREGSIAIALSDLEEAWVCAVRTRRGTEYLLELYDWRYHCVAQFRAAAEHEPMLGDVWRRSLCAIQRCSARTL